MVFGTATSYWPVTCLLGKDLYATTAGSLMPVSHSCRVHKLGVTLESAPAAGKSRTFTLYKNGASTAVACTISGTDTTGSDNTHYVDLVAGDYICVAASSSGSPSNSCGSFNLALSPVTANEYLVGAASGAASIGSSNVDWGSMNPGAWSSIQDLTLFPYAGTLYNLRARIVTAPGAGTSRTITVQKNGSSPAGTLACTISDAAVTGSDDANSVSVAAGDYVTFHHTYSGAPANAGGIGASMKFVPTTSGMTFVSYTGHGYTPSTSATSYAPVSWCGNQSPGAAITNYRCRTRAMTLKNLYVRLNASPGAGKSYAFTILKNGVATGLSVTIADSATTGNDTDDVSVSDGDILSMEIVPSGTPTARIAHWSVGMTE